MSEDQHWTAADIPDQHGKLVIVTGANSGIGYETTLALAQKGANIIMACRSLDKAESAAEKIRSQNPSGKVMVETLDLADLDSVKRFAETFLATHQKLDILINNAGVMAIPYQKTANGFEMQFGTNHLGHFALTAYLIERLQKTADSRVITVSSFAHFFGWINFDNLNGEKLYQKWIAYCQSKLANLLFAYELQRRSGAQGQDPISMAAHPGYAATNLQRSSSLFSFANQFMAQSQEMGALPTLYAATNLAIEGGEFIGPDGLLGQRGYPHKARSSGRSHNQETAQRLWTVSEEMTGVHFEI